MKLVPSRRFAIDYDKPLRRLSIVLPVYNEKATVATTIQRVLQSAVPMELELVIVDDFSSDGTRQILPELVHQMRETFGAQIQLVMHDHNQGKGAALRTGFKHAAGDIILIQDADLEYDPRDYPLLLEPIMESFADVVFGKVACDWRVSIHGGKLAGLLCRQDCAVIFRCCLRASAAVRTAFAVVSILGPTLSRAFLNAYSLPRAVRWN